MPCAKLSTGCRRQRRYLRYRLIQSAIGVIRLPNYDVSGMNTAVKQLRYEAGPWLRGGSAFSAASHRCSSSGIPTTILSPLPITPDPRTHLGARASGPHKTTAPMSRCVTHPYTHLDARASGPPKTTAPTSRWVIPPRTHLGAWASGPQVWWRQAPIGKHISAPSSLDLQPPLAGRWGKRQNLPSATQMRFRYPHTRIHDARGQDWH